MTLSPERWRQADAVLAAALDLPAAERDAYAEGACGGDRELLDLVRRLLAETGTTDRGLLDRRTLAGPVLDRLAAEAEAAAAPAAGTLIGRYRVLREIGRGGMAVVYLAERADGQFDQQVAVKLIRGTDTDDAVRRFVRERQIMALATHPNVARLLDGGATTDGRPYFVMEFVDGLPLDRYCDERRLSLEGRLRLFLQVVEAVGYAHHNLVVHRDIKPSNLLVASGGAVKLLDFGIARYLGEDEEALTRTGHRVMTPAFASPEQVRGEPVTTASDVYQLGLLLYLLAAGRSAYQTNLDHQEMLHRAVCLEMPPRPSEAWRAAGGSVPAGAATSLEEAAWRRATTPAALRRDLRGDLDNIVLMALRKEPERRYGSADQLAEDVRRYLEGLPVRAQADTFLYRTGKFLRRHRLATSAAASLVLLLIAFAVAMTVQAARVARERDRANREAATAREVADFLVETFRVADPGRAQGEEITARELLDRGAERIGTELADRPEVRATMLETIGRVYQNLGLLGSAEPLLEEALTLRRASFGGESLEVARSLDSLAWLRESQGDYVAAEPLYREALALHRRLVGEDDPRTASSLNDLALLLWHKGELDEAESLHRAALAIRRRHLGAEHEHVADSLSNLGLVLQSRGDLEGAEVMYQESLEIRRLALGENHPHVAISLDNLARVHFDRGDLEGAEPLFREALELRRRVLGPEHPDTADGLNNLAALLYRKGDPRSAAAIFREVAEVDRRVLGEDHPDYATTLGNVAFLSDQGEDSEAAEPLHRRSIAILRTALGEDHFRVALGRSNLGDCLMRLGRYPESEAEQLAAFRRLGEVLGDDHPRTRAAADRLVALYEAWGRPREADRYRGAVEPPH